MLILRFCHQDQNYKLLSSKVLYLSYLAAIFAAILDFKKRRSIHLPVLGNRQYILVKGNFARSKAGPLDYHTSDQRSRSRRYPTSNLRNDYIEARRIFYERVKNMDYIFFFDCLRIDSPPPPMICTQLIRVGTILMQCNAFPAIVPQGTPLAPADLHELGVAAVVKIYVQARGAVVTCVRRMDYSAPYSATAKKKRIARINHSCHQGWGRL